MEFKANNGIWGNMFGVPCVVADNLLKIADGEHIKVLLYILRCSGKDCTEEEISVNTGVSLQEVSKAVFFWQQANVLVLQQTDTAPPSVPPPPVQDKSQPAQQQTVTETVPENSSGQKKTIHSAPRKKTWTGTEINRRKSESPDIAELFEIAQSQMGTLNPAQAEALLYMHDYLGLKKEVIITLLSYCCSINKTNARYIESVADGWADDNINTLELAMETVQHSKVKHDYINKVMHILDVSRLAKVQEKMVEDWQKWNISIEMIEEAYDRTVKQTHELSFPYMNKILLSWHEKGFTDMKQVEDDDNLHKHTTSQKYDKKDDDFNIDMYKIFINDFEVI